MQVKDYVKPELLVVAVVLYFIGAWLKQSETVKDKYIPLINGAVGIVICAIYVFATCVCTGSQDIAWPCLPRSHREFLWQDYLLM